MKKLNRLGERYGRLLVVAPVPREFWRGQHSEWACECNCGEFVFMRSNVLREGGTRSCGCLARDMTSARSFRHGACFTRTYRSWASMNERCRRKTHHAWKHYGGRGITVCKEWRDSYEAFLADMGERPEGRTLDRIDNNGNYEPDNCRWATPLQQTQNRGTFVRIA